MRRVLTFGLLSVSLIAGAAAPVRPALADAITDAQTRQSQLNALIAKDKAMLAQVRGMQAETQAQQCGE